jgi:gliding motility-associated lipoprotein GldH
MRALRVLYILPVILITLYCSGCTDPNAVIDKNTEIDNHNWAYVNPVKYDVNITNADIPYNLYFNLRVTADYKYSNIFVLMHQTGPDKKQLVTRYEFKLANNDGEWLGNGSGNLYSYQMMYKSEYKFPAKGVYHFAIEQNMRDNPLHEVSDVGLRVEKVAQ